MTEREFCCWLRGLFEGGKPQSLDAEQTEMIRQHLASIDAPAPVVYRNLKGESVDLTIRELSGMTRKMHMRYAG